MRIEIEGVGGKKEAINVGARLFLREDCGCDRRCEVLTPSGQNSDSDSKTEVPRVLVEAEK